jgi:hypothetical protein
LIATGYWLAKAQEKSGQDKIKIVRSHYRTSVSFKDDNQKMREKWREDE